MLVAPNGATSHTVRRRSARLHQRCLLLWHNRPPARLFMGDTGSYLIGYLMAMSTLTATFAGQNVPPHAILAPLCVLAVPIYDTLTVVAIRLREGRSPFVGDKSHFSHRLVELGMTKPQAVLTIYLTSATCGLGALLLRQVNMLGAAIILLLVTCVLVLIGILETVGRRKPSDRGKKNRMARRKADRRGNPRPPEARGPTERRGPQRGRPRPLASLAAGRLARYSPPDRSSQ